MPHRNWIVQKTTRTVDRTGIAVALAFLVALGLWAGFRGEKPQDAAAPLRGVIELPNQQSPSGLP